MLRIFIFWMFVAYFGQFSEASIIGTNDNRPVYDRSATTKERVIGESFSQLIIKLEDDSRYYI